MKYIIFFMVLIACLGFAIASPNDPSRFGNLTKTTCWVGGSAGIVNCTGNAIFDGDITATNFYGTFTGNTSIWSRAGTFIFPTNIGDYVGIGTSSPQELLHVSDTTAAGTPAIRIKGTGDGHPAVEFSLTPDANEVAKNAIVVDGANTWYRGDMLFALNAETNTNNYNISTDTRMIIKYLTGYVGIGTVSPQTQLSFGAANSVIGTDTLNGADSDNLRISSAGGTGHLRGAYIRLYGNEDTPDGEAQIYAGEIGNITFFTGASDEKMRITSGGNIGIGTSSPLDILHIYEGSSAAADGLTIESRIGIAQVLLSADTDIKFPQVAFEDRDNTGTNIGLLMLDRTAPVNTGAVQNDFVLTTVAGSSSKLHLATEHIVALTVDGSQNVGIGTISPQNLLNVLGDANITGNLYLAEVIANQLIDNSMVDTLHRHSELSASDGTPDGIWTVSATGETLTASGVNNPVLHLDGLVGAYIQIDKAGTFREGLVQFQTAGATTWIIGSPDSDLLGDGDEFFIGETNSDPAFIMIPGGNVGLGIVVPTEKLEVNGSIFMTNDNDKMLFGAAKDASIYYDGTDLYIDTQEVGAGDLVISNGNVGIWTTPASILNIDLGATSDFFYFDSSAAGEWGIKLRGSGDANVASFTAIGATGEVRIGGIAATYWPTFYSGNQERMRILTGGNVGIGDTTPDDNIKLDVEGNFTLIDKIRWQDVQRKGATGYGTPNYNHIFTETWINDEIEVTYCEWRIVQDDCIGGTLTYPAESCTTGGYGGSYADTVEITSDTDSIFTVTCSDYDGTDEPTCEATTNNATGVRHTYCKGWYVE